MTPEEQANDWNRKYDSGIAVVVHGIDRPFFSVTRSSAIVFGGRACVAIDSIPPKRFTYASLDHLRPVDPCHEERLEYSRAGGDALCEICGRTLFDHPMDLIHVGYNRVPFLHVRCDGSLVKL
jgi:hypothetical protein